MKDKIIVKTYAPNIGTPDSIKQTLLNVKIQIDPNTVIIDNFNTSLSPIDHPDKNQQRNFRIK
jgi:hypothetical protein